MAYDSTNETLSSSPTGITLKEISRCIKDYRVDTNGRTDLGMMCTSPKINSNSPYKPYRDSAIETSEEGLINANCGYNTNSKSASETTSHFLSMLKASGDGSVWWTYLPPIEGNHPFRQSDFDGYRHKAKPYGEPVRFKGIEYRDISQGIQGSDFTLAANSYTSWTKLAESSSFLILNSCYLKGYIQLQEPAYSNSYMWDIEGSIQLLLVDSNGNVVEQGGETDVWSPSSASEKYYFEEVFTTSIEYGEYYHWEIWANGLHNYSRVSEDGAFFDVTYRITVVDSYSVYISRNPIDGRDGLVIIPSYYSDLWNYNLKGELDYRKLDKVFNGFRGKIIAAIELTDGSSSEYKIQNLRASNICIFNQMGFSQMMIENYTQAIVYLFCGDVDSIFGSTSQNAPYADVSAADSYALIPFPAPYHIVPDYSEGFDFRLTALTLLNVVFADGTTEDEFGDLTPNGFEYSKDEDVISFVLAQEIYTENVSSATTATIYVDISTSDDDGDILRTVSDTINITENTSYVFQPHCFVDESLSLQWIYVRAYLDIEGEIQYIDLFNQQLTYTKTSLVPLGVYVGE